jgi:glyoxylase-like metal-dependent hydrolase (beta-lactamase superfamily II)
MAFGGGPYTAPRVLGRTPIFPVDAWGTNHVESSTSALVEFPNANVFMVVDIGIGKSCNPGTVEKVYDSLLNQIKLALGEPWQGFPGHGLGKRTTARPKSKGDGQ